MPHNILEQHPYLNDIDCTEFEDGYFEGLIIGTFPVWDITDTLLPNGQCNQHEFNPATAYMRFFYGSKRNVFWELFSNCFPPNANPVNAATVQLRKQAAINLLTETKLLITDVFQRTNRNEEKAEDKNLCIITDNQFVLNNRSLNDDIDNLLIYNQAIRYLYFTATDIIGKSPFGKFREIFGNRLTFGIITEVNQRVWSVDIKIDKRKYIGFLLPSPAGNGTRGIHYGPQHQLQMFTNYLSTALPVFWQQIQSINPVDLTKPQKDQISVLRKEFLNRCWAEAFINHNVNFDGAI